MGTYTPGNTIGFGEDPMQWLEFREVELPGIGTKTDR